jgi:hypothetical protein
MGAKCEFILYRSHSLYASAMDTPFFCTNKHHFLATEQLPSTRTVAVGAGLSVTSRQKSPSETVAQQTSRAEAHQIIRPLTRFPSEKEKAPVQKRPALPAVVSKPPLGAKAETVLVPRRSSSQVEVGSFEKLAELAVATCPQAPGTRAPDRLDAAAGTN